MDLEKRKAIIATLDDLLKQAEALKKEYWYLSESLYSIYKQSPEAEKIYGLSSFASALVSHTREAAAAIKSNAEGEQYVKDSVTGWYRALHFDMSDPLIDLSEDEIDDPVYEAVRFIGSGDTPDRWEVIMLTATHGRERIIVYSDGASWQQVYNAEKI
jgi:hypothetical protein